MMNSLLSLILFGIALFTVPVSSAEFSDVGHPYHEAISVLAKDGVIQGYPDGTFRPYLAINRAEFLAILIRAEYADVVSPGPDECLQDEYIFPDVHRSQWFAPYVCVAANKGYVQGYLDGLFRPEKNISFVEAAKILALADASAPQLKPGTPWFKPFVLFLENARAIPPSIPSFDHLLTRAEMAEMLWRLREGDAVTQRAWMKSLTYDDLDAWSRLVPYESPELRLRLEYPAGWKAPVLWHYGLGDDTLVLGGFCVGCAEGDDAPLVTINADDPALLSVPAPDDFTFIREEHRKDGVRIVIIDEGGWCASLRAIVFFPGRPVAIGGFCLGDHLREWQVVRRMMETMTLLPPSSEVSFDGCGTMARYRGKSWFSTFAGQARALGFDPDEVDGFSDACASTDGSLFITIWNGGYGGDSDVLKYDIPRNILSIAKNDAREKRDHWASIMNFGKRQGAIIPLTGTSGDMGCSVDFTYDYDFMQNIVSLKKECSRCAGDQDQCKTY